ncbi:dermonecrotic toxin domain-containing protein [Pseudomonas sp. UBA6562]|uniref:dermonecrotic toxin domain-containing protein n=1 Tax=Pseudomonas sp. UBA6562 TaxID=1947332 RepID=UPI0025E75874|nr:DUF6543 domain-containing protein [Pseudomonas sp. UBA6562]
MNPKDIPSLARITQRLMAQFPDLHGLARRAAGHLVERQLGYWLDPDRLYWHTFPSAASSPLSYTGWRHRGPPQRSMTLTDLVLQRFSAQQQAAADELGLYGGFYRVDASHADYDERNEVRLSAEQVLLALWDMDFAGRYAQALQRFQAQRGDDYCVWARARFLAAVGRSALSVAERREVLAATLVVPTLPSSTDALRQAFASTQRTGWYALSATTPFVQPLFVRRLKNGRMCLYSTDAAIGLEMFESRQTLAASLAGKAVARRSKAVLGDLFVHLRDRLMSELVSDAHERLTTNAQLRKAKWLAGLETAGVLIAPLAPFGWPVVLTSLGLSAATLGLHLDRALTGKAAWRSAAWSAVVLDMLFILLDAAMMRAGELFEEGRRPLSVGGSEPSNEDAFDWTPYMAPAADELLARSDQALARQQAQLTEVPWADHEAVGAGGAYLDAFSEPYAVYRDELGFGSAAISEYTSAPERYNRLWQGLPLDGTRAENVRRSQALARALGQIGASSEVPLYRAGSHARGSGIVTAGEHAIGAGDVLVTTDFTSFTENPYALWEVFNDPQAQVSGATAFDDGAVVYVLEPGPYVKATPIAPFSSRPDEAEALMLPGRHLRVKNLRAVQADTYRFTEVRLEALAQAPEGASLREMRSGAVFDRQRLAERLGTDDDALMRTFFALPT